MGIDTLPKARIEPPVVRAIIRERVDRLLDRAWDATLTIVVGPAGAGKTTAASHLVARSTQPSLWYRAHPIDSDETILCDHLAQAIAHATGEGGDWTRLADLLIDVERRPRLPHLLVVDEFDAVIGTASERALSTVLTDVAPSIHFVTLSRHRPSLNVARLKLVGGVCEIGPDDLRFRSWEVDRLFRELYRRTLPPTEVAELERRTGGWVAALQLFNLATTGLAARERQAVLAQVGRHAGPDWDFLAENVLAGLPEQLQHFLIDTSPLPRLTAELCDELLGVPGSGRTLADLERLQLITPSLDGTGAFRSHEVLRSHLEALFVESTSTDVVVEMYRRAAELLERHGQFAEALSAYCRGEDWQNVSRLLGSRGAEVANRPGSWLATLPPTLVESDPWLLLAVARRQRADGRIADAIATYRRVERTALSTVPVTVAKRERLLLASLLDRSSPSSLGWVATLRDAAYGGPLANVDVLGGRSSHELMTNGLVNLIKGEVRAAGSLLRAARDHPDASPEVALASSLGMVIAGALGRTATAEDAAELERAASAVDVPFLSRLARAVAAMVCGSSRDIGAVVDDCDRTGDAAGAAFAAVIGDLADPWCALPTPPPNTNALSRCSALGLSNLEVWALVAAAFSGVGRGDEATAVAAEVAARRRGLRALERLAGVARRLRRGDDIDQIGRLAESVEEDHGIAAPLPDRSRGTLATAGPIRSDRSAEIQFSCFGRFTVLVNGTTVDLAPLRPRARAVLRMLAVNFGHGVHRQVLGDEFWPDDDEAGAAKKLQVAISSIRKLIEAHGAADLIRREGDVYVLGTGPHITCDVHRFASAVAEARARVVSGDANVEQALRTAVELYGGDLLSDDGAADWVVAERTRLQAAAVDSATRLASLLLERADPVPAIEVCRRGLEADRYSDPLWRLLLKALQADDDLAGHALAMSRYDVVLAELGVSREFAPSNG